VGGHAGHGTAVVAVGRGDQHRPRVLGENVVAGPGRTEHLERRQTQPERLVLDQHPAYPQFGGQGRDHTSEVGA
jgi:hypothetical protein